jgi:hypothetical protein
MHVAHNCELLMVMEKETIKFGNNLLFAVFFLCVCVCVIVVCLFDCMEVELMEELP